MGKRKNKNVEKKKKVSLVFDENKRRYKHHILIHFNTIITINVRFTFLGTFYVDFVNESSKERRRLKSKWSEC